MKTDIHFYLPQFFLEWEMFRTKVVEKTKTRFMFKTFFSPENRAVYEIMWKCSVERGRPQLTVWHMRTAGWMPKATNTRSDYVILLFHCNNGGKNAPHCYVLRTVPVLLCLSYEENSWEGPSELIWLKNGTSRWLFWIWLWNVWFHKIHENLDYLRNY